MAELAFYSKARAILRGLLPPGTPDPAALADALFAAYLRRTRFHIALVNAAAAILAPKTAEYGHSPTAFLRQCLRHDWDKLADPELAAVYALATDWLYGHLYNDRYPKPERALELFDIMGERHYARNPHHIPEHFGRLAGWCRVVPDRGYGLALPEMACDWAAIYLEKGEHSADWWYNANNGKDFLFTGATAGELEDYLACFSPERPEMAALKATAAAERREMLAERQNIQTI